MSGRTPRELAAEFGQFRKLRPGLAKAVVHIPLSAHPDDRPLSDAEMAEIADRMAQGLGYAESPQASCGTSTPTTSTCTYCCAGSTDTAKPSGFQRLRKAEAILRQIERDYRLRAVDAPGAKAPKHKKSKPRRTT